MIVHRLWYVVTRCAFCDLPLWDMSLGRPITVKEAKLPLVMKTFFYVTLFIKHLDK